MKTSTNTTGFLMATAVAVMFMNGPVMAEDQGGAQEAKVHCAGINACKGKTECKTASNECKGKNSCKGKGIVATTAQECADKGGTVQ